MPEPLKDSFEPTSTNPAVVTAGHRHLPPPLRSPWPSSRLQHPTRPPNPWPSRCPSQRRWTSSTAPRSTGSAPESASPATPNGAYLMARGLLKADPKPHISVRKFFEQYVDGWAKKKPDSEGIVATAASLAMDDAARGKLTDTTRTAFDEAWKPSNAPTGSWDWLKCGWGPFESDDHYGVTIAAIARRQGSGRLRANQPSRRRLGQAPGLSQKPSTTATAPQGHDALALPRNCRNGWGKTDRQRWQKRAA